MSKKYLAVSDYLKAKYNKKVAKIQLDANMSCPNKDGTKGFGGCLFCRSGSNEFCYDKGDLTNQFLAIKARTSLKWPDCYYIPYLQANSNTYTKVSNLASLVEPLIKLHSVVELHIATRCDCLPEDMLNYLAELNKKIPLVIELGLQTANEENAKILNRGHTLAEFTNACYELRKRDIKYTIHIINGIPNETKEDMLKTISYINSLKPHGIKFHALLVLKDTRLAQIDYTPLTLEEYVDITTTQLEYLDPNTVVYRICSDCSKSELIKPLWVLKKLVVGNEIDKEFKKRNTHQGIYYQGIPK